MVAIHRPGADHRLRRLRSRQPAGEFERGRQTRLRPALAAAANRRADGYVREYGCPDLAIFVEKEKVTTA